MQIRCPHCHSSIDVVNDAPLNEVSCPACGSAFNLIGVQQTATYPLGRNRTIAHFELLEQIGFGRFGSVWRAHDTKLDRIVAIKIPRKDQLTPEEAEQFLREARAAAQLNHPNIVPVYEVGRDGDTVYIVSAYVEGATLKEWLSGRKLSSGAAAELCGKIADALHDAHVAGVIHRDLKPGNIMLDVQGEPHIMDFGLAKRESGEITMTMEGRILGTPAYMSPEQARGEGHHADRRSDIYSLGIILFELLTGELPFRGESRMLIVQILHDEPPSPRSLNDRIPKDLETICLRCLEKDPHRRYETAREVADDLRRWLRREPIRARPITRAERAWRWCRRNPLAVGLYATTALLFVVTAVAAVSTLAWYEIDKQRSEAIKQKGIAEQKKKEAEDNLELAKKNAAEAIKQKSIADKQNSIAELKKREAEEARFEEEKAKIAAQEAMKAEALAKKNALAKKKEAEDNLTLAKKNEAKAMIAKIQLAAAEEQLSAAYREIVGDKPDRSRAWYLLGVTHLARGDAPSYQATRRKMLGRFGSSQDPETIRSLAVLATIAPTPDHLETVADVTKRVLAAQLTNTEYLEALGAAYYRAGDHEGALKHLKEAAARQEKMPARNPGAVDRKSSAWTQVFMAMTHQQLGDHEEARRRLALAERQLAIEPEPTPAGLSQTSYRWDEFVALQLLLAEAHELLGAAAKTESKSTKR